MLGVEVVDGEGDMAVAGAQVVSLGRALVDGQLQFEIGLRVAQIDQCEAVEIEPVSDIKSEGSLVKIDRTCLVEHANHRVDGFGHNGFPVIQMRGKSPLRLGLDYWQHWHYWPHWP